MGDKNQGKTLEKSLVDKYLFYYEADRQERRMGVGRTVGGVGVGVHHTHSLGVAHFQ